MKPNNLLIASDGHLKLADFGLARDFADPGYKMTCQVITRWYRPPELLFGCRYYSTAVDIWSVGCIFAELMLRIPYLPGESDMDQLKTIFRALGTPTEDDWPVCSPFFFRYFKKKKHRSLTPFPFRKTLQGHTKLPDYIPVGQFPKPPMRDLFTAASADTLNLLAKCLIYEPRKRISALDVSSFFFFCLLFFLGVDLSDAMIQALNHPYFFALPYPTHPSKLPKCTTVANKPLDEVDPNVSMTSHGPSVKATAKGLKRKLASPTEAKARSIARRLDFSKAPPSSP